MKECIQIAETVYDRVYKKNGFQGDSYKDIDIQRWIRKFEQQL